VHELLGVESPPCSRDILRHQDPDEAHRRFAAKVAEHGLPGPTDEEFSLESAGLICRSEAEAKALVGWLRERTRRLCRSPFFAAGIRAVADEPRHQSGRDGPADSPDPTLAVERPRVS
jgi:hypothetical protein